MNEADPRVQRTRKLLQEALVSLMAEKNFANITVQDIAERATLNRATFYAHFPDKFALMDHLVRETFRDEVQQRVGPSSAFTRERLHLLLITVCEFMGHFHGICGPTGPLMNPPLEAKVQDELYAYLLDWLQQHDQHPGAGLVAPSVTAAVLSWAIFGTGIDWSRSDRSIPASRWARQTVTVLLHGVLAQLPHEQATA